MENKYKFLIDGKWRDSGEIIEIKNIYTGETIGKVYQASEKDAEDAVISSIEAFKTTKKLPAYTRAEILSSIASKIKNSGEELAEIITGESGKPIKISRIEVSRAVDTFTIASEEAKRINGEYLPLDITESAKGRTGILKRFPIGPVLGITPFNFPLNLVVHKIAPALACGNTIILKPAPQSPISALKLGEIITESGAVPGAVNILPASNSISEMLVKDERIKLLTFTGSAAVGFHLKNICGKKKVVLELGGNAGVIIHSDADIHYAAERCIAGGFAYSGQMCISLQRIFVHEQIYDNFTDIFLEKVKDIKFGDTMDEDTTVGPMIDENAAVRTEEWINEAVSNGARILTGGNRNKNIFEPTVITDVSREMKICSNEIFAPVVTLSKYKDFNDAVKEVDNSRFGLQAGVFTNDINKIWYAYENIEVGGLIANDIPTFRTDHMPYGGVKDSGIGREGIKYAIEDMTERKLLVLNLRD